MIARQPSTPSCKPWCTKLVLPGTEMNPGLHPLNPCWDTPAARRNISCGEVDTLGYMKPGDPNIYPISSPSFDKKGECKAEDPNLPNPHVHFVCFGDPNAFCQNPM